MENDPCLNSIRAGAVIPDFSRAAKVEGQSGWVGRLLPVFSTSKMTPKTMLKMTPKETPKMTPKKQHFVVSKTALGSRSKSIPKIDEKMIQKMAQKVTQKVAQKVARKNRQKSGKSGWVGAFCRPAKVRNNYTRSNQKKSL